jgi:hypothetical protein
MSLFATDGFPADGDFALEALGRRFSLFVPPTQDFASQSHREKSKLNIR